jgi:hypothetical protein
MLLRINLIILFASIAVIFPIITGSITVKKWTNSPQRLIFFYFLIYAILEIVAWYYVYHHWQNHFLFNIMSYIDITFLGTYFYQVLESKNIKLLVIALISVTLLFITWSHVGTGRDFNRMDSFAISVGSLSVIFMSLLFFYQLLNNLEVENIFTYSHFWINVGILLYFSGAFFTFIFAEYIAFSKDESVTQYFQISDYLLFFQRIFLAIGLWFSKTPPQLSPSSK